MEIQKKSVITYATFGYLRLRVNYGVITDAVITDFITLEPCVSIVQGTATRAVLAEHEAEAALLAAAAASAERVEREHCAQQKREQQKDQAILNLQKARGNRRRGTLAQRKKGKRNVPNAQLAEIVQNEANVKQQKQGFQEDEIEFSQQWNCQS